MDQSPLNAEPEQSPGVDLRPSAPHLLTYGVQRPRHHRRFLFFAIFAISVVLAAKHWGPGVWHRMDLLRAQSSWINYRPPPDQIVLLQQDSYRFRFGDGYSAEARELLNNPQFLSNSVGAVIHEHVALDSFLKSAGASRNFPPSSAGNDALAFCGSRSCASGERLLLVSCCDALQYGPRWPDDDSKMLRFSVDVFTPAGLFSQLTNVSTSPAETTVGCFRYRAADVVRIFAGQPDPADRSHFTISYSINSQKGIIDGNLQPDGKTVLFAARSGGPLLSVPK